MLFPHSSVCVYVCVCVLACACVGLCGCNTVDADSLELISCLFSMVTYMYMYYVCSCKLFVVWNHWSVHELMCYSLYRRGHVKVVELLVESGCNKEATDSAGDTPLHDAARYVYW